MDELMLMFALIFLCLVISLVLLTWQTHVAHSFVS